jgi:hypothetical protein
MVEHFGMPHFFLTHIVNETTSFRWEEIIDIEKIAKQIHMLLEWKDCLIECVVLFHFRINKVMQLYLSSHHLLGNTKQHVVRYEIQQCGSLHAHIILWIMENDIEHITNEIITFVPTMFNNNKKKFIDPTDVMQHNLYKLVMREKLHTCGNRCKHKSHCKYGFPFTMQPNQQSKFNNYTNQWEYYRPRHEDCNVVSYHASLFLLWNAHLNIQCIISSYWSYYLLKYTMECEPHGTLNLNKKNGERLGLRDVSKVQLQLISSLIINKPISPQEVAFTCLQIPVVQKNVVVKYIDSKPPHMHIKMIIISRILGFHPIDVYMNRPFHFENMTFIEYFTKYESNILKRLSSKCHGEDNLGNYIYTTNKLSRFIDFHPTHNIERFVSNILLQNVCF